MLVSTRSVASPVEAVTSFMAVTNSDTRSISVFSSALMFSCEPDSTSCSMMLASRRRSNRAVVSERSMLCVSSISVTVAVAVSFELFDRLGGGVLQIVERAVDGVGGGLAGGVDHAGDLGAVVHDRAAEDEALVLDRAERVFGRLGDVGGELLALFGEGVQHAAALVGQDGGHFVGALG